VLDKAIRVARQQSGEPSSSRSTWTHIQGVPVRLVPFRRVGSTLLSAGLAGTPAHHAPIKHTKSSPASNHQLQAVPLQLVPVQKPFGQFLGASLHHFSHASLSPLLELQETAVVVQILLLLLRS
jgi:hypothetical protein